MLRPAMFLLAIGLASCGKQDADGPPSGVTTRQSARATTEPPRQDAAKPTPPRPEWRAEYDKFAAALTLSDEEAGCLKTAFETRERVISQWTAEKGESLKQMEREMQAAAKARDLTTVSRLTEQARPLRDELTKLVKTHKENIRGALTPDNRNRWEAQALSKALLNLMAPLKQMADIRAAALPAAKASASAKNPPAAGYLDLERTVEASILTAEQRTAFAAIKKKNALRSLKVDY
jgi:hypothetical protein